MYVNCHVLWSDRMYGEICAETCHKFESGVAARVTMFVRGWVGLGHDCSNVTGLRWVDRMMGRVELGWVMKDGSTTISPVYRIFRGWGFGKSSTS